MTPERAFGLALRIAAAVYDDLAGGGPSEHMVDVIRKAAQQLGICDEDAAAVMAQ
jgi:hypothetical protein